ncbi:MAG: alkaline shock response membrane anchor protein AmaP [Actinomycetota bacterium]|nr:alkaline shock response membrane anchor protein AmaP [Actinomycetota bacterium]
MTDKGGRRDAVVLTLLGVGLAALGGYGLARGYGAFGSRRADEAVLGDAARDFVSRHADWFWPLAALASVLIAYVGLRWLVGQLRSGHISRLDVTEDRARGTTVVRAASAADALARDVGRYPGVRSAKARLVADGARPEVDLTVEVLEDAAVPDLHQRIESHAFSRFREALGVEDLRARVRFRVSEAVARTR